MQEAQKLLPDRSDHLLAQHHKLVPVIPEQDGCSPPIVELHLCAPMWLLLQLQHIDALASFHRAVFFGLAPRNDAVGTRGHSVNVEIDLAMGLKVTAYKNTCWEYDPSGVHQRLRLLWFSAI